MSETEPVGYGKPPHATRFRKGQSGNPGGRPINRHREIPYDAVLGQMVTVREDGRERRVTAAEAFMLRLVQMGLAGDSSAARSALEAIETARARRPEPHRGQKLTITFVAAGTNTILGPLGIACKKFATDQTRVRFELQPWIVEAALARLAPRQLTEEQQREVWTNTRTPHKVQWPTWWVVRS